MKYLILIFSALILGACTNSAEPDHSGHSDAPSHHDTDHSDRSHDAIELNNGAKWKADSEMFEHVQAMKKDLAAFNGEALEDFHALGISLSGHTQNFISSCTMKGKGHDELHKWLHPFMQQVDALQSAETTKSADALVVGMEKSLVEFDRYFE